MTATPAQTQALFKVVRAAIDATGWGSWVKDAALMPYMQKGADAVLAAGPKTPPVVPPVTTTKGP